MRRAKRIALRLSPIVLVLAACHASTPIGRDIAGVYSLVKVDGTPIPGEISHDGTNLRLESGEFVIEADGTCSSKTRFLPPGASPVTRRVLARYERNGPELTMQWEGAGRTTGRVDGDRFVLDNHGMIFEYTRSTD